MINRCDQELIYSNIECIRNIQYHLQTGNRASIFNLPNMAVAAIAFFSEETAIYDIGQKYSTLTGTLAVTKADSGPLDSEQNGYVRIYGDDVLLWEDCTLNSYTKPYDFSVDITGVTDLKITANGYSANLGWDYLAVILENVSLQ